MALTRVTSTVLDANAVSAEKLANSSIVTRHLGDAVVTLRNLAADANTASASAGLTANVNLVQSNVAALTARVNVVKSNVDAAEANIALVLSNLNFFAGFSNTTFDTRANAYSGFLFYTGNDYATYTTVTDEINRVQTNVNTNYLQAQSNDFATYTRLYANINSVQTNVSAITSGATVFTTNKIFEQNVTIQGNLIVVGSQVDLSVGSATISDAILTLSANLAGDTPPPADSGLLLNRGSQGNVFIGYAAYGSHIDFVYTRSPSTNTTIRSTSYVDVHANTFGIEGGNSVNYVAYGRADETNTGIYFPAASTIGIVTGGVEQVRIGGSGNVSITSGILEGPLNVLDLDDDELTDRANSITLRSTQSVGIFLDTANSTTDNFLAVYNNKADPNAVTIDEAIFSIRDNGEVFTKDGLNIKGNANVVINVVAGNALIAPNIFEAGVGLRANDYATYTILYANINSVQSNVDTNYLQAQSNDYLTYTRITANVNAVQGNLTSSMNQMVANVNTVQDNVTALTTGAILLVPFTNTNVSTSSSNVYFVGKNVANYSNIISVTVDGIYQAPIIDWVGNFANDTVQFTDAALPAGLSITISSLT
jgi:hypothetical protein